MAEATALLPSAEEFLRALDAVPTGTFNKHTMQAIRARVARAEELGIPVLVKLGDTKFFAVRDGPNFNRNVVGGWGARKVRGVGRENNAPVQGGPKVELDFGVVQPQCLLNSMKVLVCWLFPKHAFRRRGRRHKKYLWGQALRRALCRRWLRYCFVLATFGLACRD